MTVALALLLWACGQDDLVVIRAGKICTVSAGVVDQGILVVERGRIKEVGRRIDIPPQARVLEFGRLATVVPGFIDMHSHLGSAFDRDEVTESITPEALALDAFRSSHPDVTEALGSGVTLVAVSPGNRNVVGGQVGLIRLTGTLLDQMVFRIASGLKISLTAEALFPDREPTSKVGAGQLLRRHLHDPKSGTARAVFGEGGRVWIHALSVDEIHQAAALKREFALTGILLHADEGGRALDAIRNAGFPVVVGPLLVSDRREKLEMPGRLARSGVVLAFAGDAPRTSESYLRVSAVLAVKHGLDRDVALRGLTLSAAEMLGVSDQLGSLESGKLADLVVFSGDPLELSSVVELVVVGGKVVYSRRAQ